LTATSNEDKTKASKLQLDLMRRAQPRQKELIAEVESGPPRNRSIAASALGFTRGEQVLSPLLAALHDADPDVVHNALLALALVQMPATPLEPLADVLATHADAHTRANAAYAIRTVLEAGGTAGPAVVNTVRLALADSEPLVQVQAALALGLVHDADSIEPLSNLLHDSMPLVSLSASQALVLIGASNDQVKGKVARVLALAYEQGKGRERDIALRGLIALSGQNLGEESKAWTDWARRLP
jgi:HEAT repeat protein